ncbi:hypothetical protein E1B28_010107 [Marasmius oreades]|uniref:Peptidase A22B, signal peptide peptidase n=1 Tax=Marasmius oreades TaxID=181124 RepID=A0A9P7RXW9_9AGAR|nr:uncharacterized protein E1B28_010107 [Marasmius oreades]KAG7091048.1 hypothetical protein E1B28_010107 [Marasmius oreades]
MNGVPSFSIQDVNWRSLLPRNKEIDWDLLSSYAGLLGLACLSIYCGAYGSVGSGKDKEKKKTEKDEDEDESEDNDEDMEVVSLEDAWWFPVIGSFVLFGLFLVIKYFGKEWINWVLGWYFSFAGVGSIARSAIALTKFVIGRERWGQFERIEIKVNKGKSGKSKVEKSGDGDKKKKDETLLSISWRTPSMFLIALSTIPSVLYRLSPPSRRSVLFTDILAMSFSHNALSLIKLDSFATGCALLSGLFVYDIWWVFGTRVMVEVATGLDVPIKLLWAKSLHFSDARGFTMLGLGDIVIPGTFITLALRFDLRNGRTRTPWFFYGTLTAYVLGLVATMTVMHVWGHAQPALLYLSPGCIGGFVLVAVLRGELAEAWKWKC